MADLPPTFVKGFHNEDAVRKMTYHKLGRTGLLVSKLSLGGGTLHPLYGQEDEEEAIRAIHQAIKNGINYIDTAPYYGQGRSEKIIGRALKDIPREAYYIATKVGRYEQGAFGFDFSAKRTKESVDISLGYLGLDYVDIIQIHDVEFADNMDIVVNETLPALEEVRATGKVKFIGVSAYPLSALKEVISKAPGRFDTVLAYSRYTMLDDSLLEYLPFFLEQDLGVICAANHALSLLTNRGAFDWHPANEKTVKQGRLAGEYCKQHGIELGKLAIWYALQLKGPATFLVGMPNPEIVRLNFESFNNGLSPKESEALDYCLKNFCAEKSHWEGNEAREFAAEKFKYDSKTA